MTEDETLGVARDRRLGTDVQGRYRILRKLGEGGMGCVYEAEHLLIRRKVAIKTLHPHLSTNPHTVARFRREAMAATATRNEHVVEVTDMGQFDDDGALYIVLELLEGRDLSDEIAAVGPMSLGRVSRIVCQICDALDVLHREGIIHRDLKPENLFLTRRSDNPDFIKILDFGISKFQSSLDGQPTKLTADGMMVGTAHFMSPEQASARADVDHRTDLYALGGIIYTMLTGALPFEAETLPLLFVKVVSEPPEPVSRKRPDLPDEIVRAVTKCLAKRPEDRFQSAADVRRVFAKYVSVDTPPVIATALEVQPTIAAKSDDYVPALSTPSRDTQAPKPRSMGVWMALGAVAAAGVLAVATLALRERSEAPAPAAPLVTAPNVPSVPVPDDVRIRVWTQPPGAELFLDGAPIPNPFDDERAPSPDEHTLEARLAGSVVSERVRFDRDANVRLVIDVTNVAPAPTVAPTAPRRRLSEPAPAAPAPSPAPAPVVAAPAPTTPAPTKAPEPSSAENDVLGKRKLKRLEF